VLTPTSRKSIDLHKSSLHTHTHILYQHIYHRLPRIVSKSSRRKLQKKNRVRREKAWDSTSSSKKVKTFDDIAKKDGDVSRWLQTPDSVFETITKIQPVATSRDTEEDFRKVLENMETRAKEMEEMKKWTHRVYDWWRETERNEKMKLEEKMLSKMSLRLRNSRELIESSPLPLLQMPTVRTSMSELGRTYRHAENLLQMKTLDMPVRTEQLHFEKLVRALLNAEIATKQNEICMKESVTYLEEQIEKRKNQDREKRDMLFREILRPAERMYEENLRKILETIWVETSRKVTITRMFEDLNAELKKARNDIVEEADVTSDETLEHDLKRLEGNMRRVESMSKKCSASLSKQLSKRESEIEERYKRTAQFHINMSNQLNVIQHLLNTAAHVARCDVSAHVFDATLEESKATSVQRLVLRDLSKARAASKLRSESQVKKERDSLSRSMRDSLEAIWKFVYLTRALSSPERLVMDVRRIRNMMMRGHLGWDLRSEMSRQCLESAFGCANAARRLEIEFGKTRMLKNGDDDDDDDRDEKELEIFSEYLREIRRYGMEKMRQARCLDRHHEEEFEARRERYEHHITSLVADVTENISKELRRSEEMRQNVLWYRDVHVLDRAYILCSVLQRLVKVSAMPLLRYSDTKTKNHVTKKEEEAERTTARLETWSSRQLQRPLEKNTTSLDDIYLDVMGGKKDALISSYFTTTVRVKGSEGSTLSRSGLKVRAAIFVSPRSFGCVQIYTQNNKLIMSEKGCNVPIPGEIDEIHRLCPHFLPFLVCVIEISRLDPVITSAHLAQTGLVAVLREVIVQRGLDLCSQLSRSVNFDRVFVSRHEIELRQGVTLHLSRIRMLRASMSASQAARQARLDAAQADAFVVQAKLCKRKVHVTSKSFCFDSDVNREPRDNEIVSKKVPEILEKDVSFGDSNEFIRHDLDGNPMRCLKLLRWYSTFTVRPQELILLSQDIPRRTSLEAYENRIQRRKQAGRCAMRMWLRRGFSVWKQSLLEIHSRKRARRVLVNCSDFWAQNLKRFAMKQWGSRTWPDANVSRRFKFEDCATYEALPCVKKIVVRNRIAHYTYDDISVHGMDLDKLPVLYFIGGENQIPYCVGSPALQEIQRKGIEVLLLSSDDAIMFQALSATGVTFNGRPFVNVESMVLRSDSDMSRVEAEACEIVSFMRRSVQKLTCLQRGAELHWAKERIIHLRDLRFTRAVKDFEEILNRLNDVPLINVEETTLSSCHTVLHIVQDTRERVKRTSEKIEKCVKWIETCLQDKQYISFEDAKRHVQDTKSAVLSVTVAVRSARLLIQHERERIITAYRERKRMFRERYEALYEVYVNAVRKKIETNEFRDIDRCCEIVLELRKVLEKAMQDFSGLSPDKKDFCSNSSASSLTLRLDSYVRVTEKVSRTYILAVRREQRRICLERKARTKYAKAVLKRLHEESFNPSSILLSSYMKRLQDTLEWNDRMELFQTILKVSIESQDHAKRILSHSTLSDHILMSHELTNQHLDRVSKAVSQFERWSRVADAACSMRHFARLLPGLREMLWMTRDDRLLISDLPSYNRKMLVSIDKVWNSVRQAEISVTTSYEQTFPRLLESSENCQSESYVCIRSMMECAVRLFDEASGLIQDTISRLKTEQNERVRQDVQQRQYITSQFLLPCKNLLRRLCHEIATDKYGLKHLSLITFETKETEKMCQDLELESKVCRTGVHRCDSELLYKQLTYMEEQAMYLKLRTSYFETLVETERKRLRVEYESRKRVLEVQREDARCIARYHVLLCDRLSMEFQDGNRVGNNALVPWQELQESQARISELRKEVEMSVNVYNVEEFAKRFQILLRKLSESAECVRKMTNRWSEIKTKISETNESEQKAKEFRERIIRRMDEWNQLRTSVMLSEMSVLRPAVEHMECTMMALNDPRRGDLNMFNFQDVRDAYYESYHSYRHAVLVKRQTAALYVKFVVVVICCCRCWVRALSLSLSLSHTHTHTHTLQLQLMFEQILV